MGRPAPFVTPYMVGREDKRTNNRTMLPTLKSNPAAGYQESSEIELLKGTLPLLYMSELCCFLVQEMLQEPQEEDIKGFTRREELEQLDNFFQVATRIHPEPSCSKHD